MIKKGIQGKNNVQRDLSVDLVQKFNGYEISKTQLIGKEKRNHEPVDIIYEPVNDKRHIQCFFTDDLHLAYRSYYSQKNGTNKVTHPITKKCYYCDKYFTWHKSRFYDHVKTCSDIAGIVYKFKSQKLFHFRTILSIYGTFHLRFILILR